MSVILAARNAEATLEHQLAALSAQTYQGWWEVIVVDNGSHDGTAAIAYSWASRFPRLRIISATERFSVAYARNVGCRESYGDLLVFCDADDVVDVDWVQSLVDTLQKHAAAGGMLERERLNGSDCLVWRPQRPRDALPNSFEFLPHPPGANCGVRSEVWRRVGGFDENLRDSEDVDFFWRVQLAGFDVAFSSGATVFYRHRPDLGSFLLQSYRYARSHVALYKKFSPYGMPRRTTQQVCLEWFWLVRHLPDLVGERATQGIWLGRLARNLGRIIGSVRELTMYL